MQSLIAAVLLVGVHLGAGSFRRLEHVPRSRWLSAAGGVALAYVFVHLLPELAAAQEAVETTGFLSGLERHLYVVALVGVLLFYSLEQLARRSKQRADEPVSDRVGWVQIASYGAYNAIIGYVLARRGGTAQESLWLFSAAMAVHFVVNDHSLRQHHRRLYDRVGRWLVSTAILLGWSLAAFVQVGDAGIGPPLAFIAGGVVLNVLKDELPEERQSRLLPFVGAGSIYAALLLAV